MNRNQRHYNQLGLQQGASKGAVRKAYQEWMRANNPLFETDPDERWAKTQVMHSIEASVEALLGRTMH